MTDDKDDDFTAAVRWAKKPTYVRALGALAFGIYMGSVTATAYGLYTLFARFGQHLETGVAMVKPWLMRRRLAASAPPTSPQLTTGSLPDDHALPAPKP